MFTDVLDSVPDLSPKIVTFALQHRSSMHDIFLLIQFATDLATSGNKAGALSLFSNLLRLWTGKLDQTAIIKRCLNFCWLKSDSDPASSVNTPSLRHPGSHHQLSQAESRGASGDGQQHGTPQATHKAGSMQQGARNKHSESTADTPPEPAYNIASMLEFMQHQRGLCAAEFVAVLANLGVPRAELIQVCKGVLALHAPDSDSDVMHAPNAFATPNGGVMHASHAGQPQSAQSSAYGDLPTEDLGLEGPKEYSSGSGSGRPAGATTVMNRSSLPNTPLFNNTKVSFSGGGRYSTPDGGSYGGVPNASTMTEVSRVGKLADRDQQYAELAEALALVPRLVEMIEADLREDSEAKVSAVGRDLTAALGIDLGQVVNVPSMCDTRDVEPAEIRLLQGRAAAAAKRKRWERGVAAVAALGAVFVPGGLGRLLTTLPALVVISRN